MTEHIIRTTRLVLSPPTADDAAAIAIGADDPDVARWTPLPSPYRLEHAEAFIRLSEGWWASGGERTWAIRADGVFAGMIGLMPRGAGEAEAGYWLAAPWRGRGFAAEALAAVVDVAFADDGLALHRIIWRAGVGNLGSARTAQRVGFRFEGTQRQSQTTPRGVSDGWIAALLRGDSRSEQPWPILDRQVSGPSGTLIRSFRDRDADQVVALWDAAGLIRAWNDPRRDIMRAVSVDPGLFLIAEAGGAVVGTTLAGYDGHRGSLSYVATAPDRRGAGIAAALVREAEQRLVERGCPKVNLMVRPENAQVQGFYRALGYEQFETWNAGKRLIED